MTGGEPTFRHQKLIGISLIAGPLAMLAADAAAALAGDGAFWISTMGLWLAFYAYAGASFGMMVLAGHGGVAVAGGLLTLFGALIGATIMGLERMAWSMRLHQLEADQVIDVLTEPAVFFTSRAPGLTFPLGLLLLTFALTRAGALSRVAAGVLAVGIVLFPVGRIVAGPWANVVGDGLMLATLGPLGARTLAGRAAGLGRPADAAAGPPRHLASPPGHGLTSRPRRGS